MLQFYVSARGTVPSMATDRRLQFVRWQVAWMLLTILALSAFGMLSYELFFVGSLVGFLVVMELTAPAIATPAWRARLWWFLTLGLLGFAFVIARRISVTLP
jgi:hypothetical protein